MDAQSFMGGGQLTLVKGKAVPASDFMGSGKLTPVSNTPVAPVSNLAQTSQAQKMNVPESQQAKMARLQLETLQAQDASKKANSFMEKWVKPIADTVLPGVYSLGETYQGGINSSVQTKGTVEDTNKLYDSNIQIIKRIRELKKTGKDTSNLQQQYNQNVDLINYLNQNLQSDTRGANKTNLQVGGELGMTALNILTAGTYGKVANKAAPSAVTKVADIIKQPSKLFSLKTASKVAQGAGLGEAYDVAGNLQQGITGSDAITKGYGKYIGGAIPIASKGLSKVAEMTPSLAKNRFINNINDIFHNAPKSVSNVVDKAENQVHLAQYADEQGVNLGREIADRGFMPIVQNERMTFGAKPFATLDAEIAQDSRLVDDVVAKYPDTKVSVEDAKKLVASQIEQNPVLYRAGKVQALTTKANNVIDELAAQSGKDYFTLPELQNFKKGMWNESKKFEHKVSGQADAYSEVGSTFRKIIEEEVPDVAIFAINQRIGRAQNLYYVLDKINSLQGGGLVLKGGKIGKYVGDITGTVIGGGIGAGVGGPVGAGIGALVGKNTSSLLRNLSQKSSILGPLDRILLKFAEKQGESSAVIEARAFLESVKNGKAPSVTPRVQQVFDKALEEARKEELLASMRLDKNYYNNLLDQGVEARNNRLPSVIPKDNVITPPAPTTFEPRANVVGSTDSSIKPNSPTIGKTVDPLIQEAKKYKSAAEFVKAQGTPVYHGTDAKFDTFNKPSGKPGSEGIFVGTSKSNADYYKRTPSGEIKELYLGKSAKIWDYKNPQDVEALQKKIIEFVPENKNRIEWNKLNAEKDKIVERGIYENYSLKIRPEDLKRFNEIGEKLDNIPNIGGADAKTLADKITGGWYTDLSEALKNPQVKKWFEQNYDGWKQLDHTDYGTDTSIGVFSPDTLKPKSQLTDIWNKAHSK